MNDLFLLVLLSERLSNKFLVAGTKRDFSRARIIMIIIILKIVKFNTKQRIQGSKLTENKAL